MSPSSAPSNVKSNFSLFAINFSPFVRLSVAFTMGLFFGLALEKGGVYLPLVIQSQMFFTQNTMLKMFLSAAATSGLVLAALRLIDRDRVSQEYTSDISRGFPALIVGGLILGVGMALGGSCPGTVWVQAGANLANWGWGIAGGLLAGLVYSWIHSHFDLSNHWFYKVGVSGRLAIGKPLHGVLFSLALFLVVAIVDWLQPEAPIPPSASLFAMKSWHPAISGMIVGLLNLPAALIIKELIGSSQSYVNTCALVFSNKYLERYAGGAENKWQVIYALGAFTGSAISSFWSHEGSWLIPAPNPLHPVASLLGGFFLVFGARVAAGCTSGHGISGMGSGSLGSMLAVCGMFGGAIAFSIARYFITGYYPVV